MDTTPDQWSTEDSRELYLCSERQVRGLDEDEWARWVRLERLNQDQIELFAINSQGELLLRLSDYVSPVREIPLQKVLESTGLSVAPVRFPELIHRQLNRLNLAFSTSIYWESEPHKPMPADFVRYQGIYPLKVNNRREILETIVGYETLSRFPIDPALARRCPVGRHRELKDTATRSGEGLRHVAPIYALECGSRPELLIALAYLDRQRELMARHSGMWGREHALVLNGPKDPLYVRTALEAMKRGLNVILVIDSPGEHGLVLKMAQDMWPGGQGIEDLKLGVRIKTLTRGSGIWEESGGKESKFGLCGVELYHFLKQLLDANLEGCLRLVHFHVGSQLVEWESITDSTMEITRLYLELRDKGFDNLCRIDLGGGLAVNYDQHLMKEQSSALYDHEDYADMVVRTISKVLQTHLKGSHRWDAYGPLTISSESGRFITSTYTIVAAQVLESRAFHYPAPPDFDGGDLRSLYDVWRVEFPSEYDTFEHKDLEPRVPPIMDDSHLDFDMPGVDRRRKRVLDSVVWNLHRLLRHFGLFAPAALLRPELSHWRADANEFFDLSYLEILAGAVSEVERYVGRIGKYSFLNLRDRLEYEFLLGGMDRLITTAFRFFCEQQEDIVAPKGFPYHPYIPSRRYIVNMSTFGQLIDTQLVNQYFPVIPLTHLDRKPDYMASIGDLTCDSGGEIKKFLSFVDRNWGFSPGEISTKASISKCFTAKDHKVMAIPGERLDLQGVPVHAFDPVAEKYFIAWLFVGAYQDVLRTRHNLFGQPHSVLVSHHELPWLASTRIDSPIEGLKVYIEAGEHVGHLIEELDYDIDDIRRRLNNLFPECVPFIEDLLRHLPYYTRRADEPAIPRPSNPRVSKEGLPL